MRLLKVLVYLLFSTWMIPGAKSQAVEYMHINVIKNLENLSVANVNSIVRDKFGYTWLATQEGLFRYDGLNAVYYGKNSDNHLHDLPNNSVTATVISADSNSLWAINSFSGLSKIDILTGNIIKYVPFPKDGLVSENYFVRGNCVINKNIYFVFENGIAGLVNQSTDKISYVNLHSSVIAFGNINDYFYCINEQYRLMLFDANFNKLPVEIPLDQYAADSRLQTYAVLNDAATIISLNKYLLKLSFDKTNKSFAVDNLNLLPASGANITTIQRIDNQLYVGLEDKLLCCDLGNGSVVELISGRSDDQKWAQGALVIKQFDKQLWIGSELGIATVNLNDRKFMSYTHLNDTKLNHCYGLSKATGQELFVNTTDGLFTVNLSNRASLKIDDRYNLYTAKAPGGIYISSHTSGSTAWKMSPAATRVYPNTKILDSLLNDILVGDAAIGDSLFFFASLLKKGLVMYNSNSAVTRFIGSQTTPAFLKNSNINSLFVNARGQLLIACDNVISVLDPVSGSLINKQVLDPASQQPLNIIHDLCEINGRYFMAVYGVGIVETDGDFKVLNIYNKENGIDNINLYKIFNIGDSSLVTSSNNGLFILNLHTRHVSKYYERDGLHGNGFEQFSGCRINDSTIAMGGVDGFTIINTGLLQPNNAAPQLYFRKISIETSRGRIDTSNLLMQSISIPSDALQTTISLSGINYGNPGRVSFSWKILENPGGWVNIGTQPFISFVGLGPGTYHLLVRATNEDGVAGQSKELVLIFLPKWYQTWWFYTLIILVVAGILYLLYRYRVSQIKKQHEIRKNIATDLHDDLGSTLNSVKIFTNLAISGVNQNESLQQVKDNLNEATVGLRDMIWVLDDSLDTVDELVTRLKQFAIPVTLASNINMTIEAGSEVSSRKLSKEEKRNLFLVCKEAINNSIKYSGAANINVVIEPDGKKIRITVSDDGKGFDIGKIKAGYGLKNMQYRAGQVKYHATIKSSLGGGTVIIIKPA